MKKMLTTLISHSINALLSLDPESKLRVQKLQDKVIAIELKPFHFTIQCLFNNGMMYIQDENILSADATIRGTPLQMAGVALTKENRHQFFADGVVIEGSAEVAQEVIELFDLLHIDWEEHLSALVGDTTAFRAMNIAKRAKRFIGDVSESLTQNVSEYLQEEKEWLPTREALNDLFDDIDALRMDVDRAEATVDRLRLEME